MSGSEMTIHLISKFLCQAVSWVAGENILPLDRAWNGLHLIVNHRKATDSVVVGASWGLDKPLADFLAAPVNVKVRGAPDDTLQWQVLLMPKPTEHEEGQTCAPDRGKSHLGLRWDIQKPVELLHARPGGDVRVVAVVGIQDSIEVENDEVDFHSREARTPGKRRVRTAAAGLGFFGLSEASGFEVHHAGLRSHLLSAYQVRDMVTRLLKAGFAEGSVLVAVRLAHPVFHRFYQGKG